MFFRRLFRVAVLLVLALALTWAALALYLDFPVPELRLFLAFALLCLVAAIFIKVRPRALATGACFGLFAIVLGWWLTLAPSNDRPWLPDVAQTPWAVVQGDTVVIHNLRNFDYTTETDYRANWETRTVDLSQIQAIDLYMSHWGSPAIAHTMLSFEFANNPPVAISIETRKQSGQSYSAFLGFFRQYTLIYVIADERDIIRVRTNFRHEDVYLYRTRSTPARARAVFLSYLQTANELRVYPQWYNALTSNCTTDIRPHLMIAGENVRIPWDWRILLNGYADHMAYDRGRLASDGLPFDELKRRAYIDAAARAANDAPDFSRRIRIDRPGFEQDTGPNVEYISPPAR